MSRWPVRVSQTWTPPIPPGPPAVGGVWLQTGLSIGDAVRATSVADTVALTQPATFGSAFPFVGLIVSIPAPGTAGVVYYGEYPWGGPPLIPGAPYYLGVVAGSITTVPLGGPAGAMSLRIGYAKSGSVLILAPGEPVEL